MSRRTRTNLPLPVIGSTGWGGTLNNYLTNQTYAQTELETEIQKIYDNRMNVAQTVLSSGIIDATVDDYKIGLYDKSNNYIAEGAALDSTKQYHFKGWAAIVGNTNITESFGGKNDERDIPFFDARDGLKFTNDDIYDARCVYLHYDLSKGSWNYTFGITDSPSTETNVSVHPYYICLGVVIRINNTNYWHYKTMKSNVSISSKKWMLDEPHANLNTYMNWISTSKSLSIHTDKSYFQNAVLTIQALGINPFTETESVTNEYNSDIATYNLGTYSSTEGAKGSIWNCLMLCSKWETKEGESEATLVTGHKFSESNTTSLNLGDWVDGTSFYRICASSLIVEGKPVLFLQQAVAGTKIDEALFDESEFGRLMYYADPVELYRIEGNTMTAAVGDGISTINANGINPHVTTVIRNSDDVRFGEDTEKSFHFKTDKEKPANKLELTVPNPNSGSTSFVLTNNMRPINNSIRLYSNNTISLESKDEIKIGYDNKANVSGTICAKYPDDSTHGGEITSLLIDGDRKALLYQDGTGLIKIVSTLIDSSTKETIDESKIELKHDGIHLTGDSVVPVTRNFQINNGSKAYIAIQHNESDRPTITFGTNTNKKIRLTADGGDGEKPTIELGTLGGDCCKLSSDGLYLPSGSDGVVIDRLGSSKTIVTNDISLAPKSYTFYQVNDKSQTVPVISKKYVHSFDETETTTYFDGDGCFYVRETDKTEYIKCKLEQIPSVPACRVINTATNEYLKLYNTTWRYHKVANGESYFYAYDEEKPWIIDVSGVTKKTPLIIKKFTETDLPLLTVNKTEDHAMIDIVNDKTFINHFHGSLNMTSIASDGIINLGYADDIADCGTNHGQVLLGYNGTDGEVKVHTNVGEITITNNSGEIYSSTSTKSIITLNDKFVIKDNICYYDNGQIDYDAALTKVKDMSLVAAQPNVLWRIYGFSKEENCVDGEGEHGAAAMLSRGFGNEEDNNYTYHLFLPDIGQYIVQFEIYDSMSKAGIPGGNVISFRSASWDLYTAQHEVGKLLFSKGDYPSLTVTPYWEEDRICVKLSIDANLNISGSVSAWGFRVAFVRDWDENHKYYVAPVCKIK